CWDFLTRRGLHYLPSLAGMFPLPASRSSLWLVKRDVGLGRRDVSLRIPMDLNMLSLLPLNDRFLLTIGLALLLVEHKGIVGKILDRQFLGIHHDSKWIDPDFWCSFKPRLSGRRSPYSDSGQDHDGGNCEQSDLQGGNTNALRHGSLLSS